MTFNVQAVPAAAKQAPPLARKRKKENASAKRLRARKKARAAARAVAHTATVVPCSSTSLAAPDAVTVSETGRQASEAAPEVSTVLQATPQAVAVATETSPVTMDASLRRKKQRTRRTSLQLAPVLIAALEEEKEASREPVATPIPDVTKVGEYNDRFFCHTETTRSTNSDTDYESSGTNSDSDSDCEMYWRIYGKNYERSKLTVTANYASTKEKWQVARINDRRGDSLLEYKYQVLWVNPLVKRRRYYQRTWEPRAQLLADDFRKEIELVDRWKASEVKTFAKFWPTDEYGKNAIAELAGRPDIVTKKDIDEFVEYQMISRGEDVTKGTSWKVALVFLRHLRDACRDFIYRAIALDNFAVAGRRGVRVLSEIELKNGVYVDAAYNHESVGHAFVLTVHGKNRLIYDLEEGKPVESAEDWIDFYAFVRPFIVCKQN